MSRKNQKKNQDDLADKVLTGIAVGVTVAAAGAAIGYLGRQIFSAWQASQEKEEKVATTMPNSAKNFNEEDDLKKPKAISNSSTVGQICGKTSVTSGLVAVKKLPELLHDQLLVYFKEYVDIPKADVLSADNVVQQVLSALNRRVRGPQLARLKVGDLAQFGSFTEDLAVVRTEKFDVMVPIMLRENCEIRALSASEGSFLLQVQHVITGSSSCTMCDCNHHLEPKKIARFLFDPFQQACFNLPFRVEAVLDNSVISLMVKNHHGQLLSINLVPVVIIGGKLYMPNERFSPNENHSNQWYTLYARQEQWSIDRFDSSICGHRTAFKILKAIRLNHLEQFNHVSSYHLKHVLFHVLDDLPDSSDWTDVTVGERLIDLLARLTQALNEHSLPHYFEPNVNLLYHVPKEDCMNLAKFIEKKLGFNDIPSLLERRY